MRLAFNVATQSVIHIRKADNGLSCGCICEECQEKLEAIQGQERDWHFRHNINKNCKGAQESALHKLGKQILVENEQINIPVHGTINYYSPIPEILLNTKRPDVSAQYSGEPIYFEIAVKHFMEEDKASFLNNGLHRCVEIDLSNVETTSYDQIKNFVLLETNNKKLFGWGKQTESNSNSESLVLKIIGGVAFFLFLRWLFKGGRR